MEVREPGGAESGGYCCVTPCLTVSSDPPEQLVEGVLLLGAGCTRPTARAGWVRRGWRERS